MAAKVIKVSDELYATLDARRTALAKKQGKPASFGAVLQSALNGTASDRVDAAYELAAGVVLSLAKQLAVPVVFESLRVDGHLTPDGAWNQLTPMGRRDCISDAMPSVDETGMDAYCKVFDMAALRGRAVRVDESENAELWKVDGRPAFGRRTRKQTAVTAKTQRG